MLITCLDNRLVLIQSFLHKAKMFKNSEGNKHDQGHYSKPLSLIHQKSQKMFHK